jgi:cell division protein FtsQ
VAIQTQTDRRFRRAHVKPSRRRRASVETRRLAAGTIVFCGVSLAAFLLPSVLSSAGFLQVTTITIRGQQHVSPGEVFALIGQLRGQNILMADLEMHRQHLMTSTWVKTATLRRILPSTIEVSVEERDPIGLARVGGRLYLIDGAGAVIDEYGSRFDERNLPIIDGVAPGNDGVVDEVRAQFVSDLVVALEAVPALSSQISQINVEDPYDAVVLLNDGPTLIHLGHEQFAERLLEYFELAPVFHAHVADIDYVDLRFDGRVFIRSAEPGTHAPLVVSNHARRVELQ